MTLSNTLIISETNSKTWHLRLRQQGRYSTLQNTLNKKMFFHLMSLQKFKLFKLIVNLQI